MAKLGLKQVPGVTRVTIRKSKNILFVIAVKQLLPNNIVIFFILHRNQTHTKALEVTLTLSLVRPR